MVQPYNRDTPPLLTTTISWNPQSQGIRLLELFGGIASGLEACLQSGLVVHQYFFVDTDSTAVKVAQLRMAELSHRFPSQFSREASKLAFTFLPPDIQLIQRAHLHHMGPLDLIIAGWECQGFSMAGAGQGLHDPRLALFTDLLRVLSWDQQVHPTVGYIVENTAAQYDQRPQVQEHYLLVQQALAFPYALMQSNATR